MDIQKAKEFVIKKHEGQVRKHGTPYYSHPFAVADILKNKGYDMEHQLAGLFHDLIEDTNATYDEIISFSNGNVANVVKLLTKESGYNMQEYIKRISENNMAKMVKLADRIHNLSEANLANKQFRDRYVKETEEWYVNLAKSTCFEEDLINVLKTLK